MAISFLEPDALRRPAAAIRKAARKTIGRLTR
jgi:hypothetical protein